MRTTLLLLLLSLAAAPPTGTAAAPQATQSQPQETQATTPPTREVRGRVLVSAERPAARIEFDKKFKYVGGQAFTLYNVARAEQHFFVDADAGGRIRRLYWVQFEGYLPDNTHAYDYKSDHTERVGPFDFFADSHALNIKASASRPDSDGARAQSFLESKGLRMGGDDVLLQRLVHLIDASRRDELLIIYLEDLGLMKLTAADLAPGGRAAERWPQVSRELRRRAVRGVKISR